ARWNIEKRMQHKKYQRKYKFSLVFGPTLWGHHIALQVVLNKYQLRATVLNGVLFIYIIT
ncbi:hypothetical protein, partial [Peptoniphilus harei]